MNSLDSLPEHATELTDAARALARTEETLKLLSASWYQLGADAVPAADGLSHEQEVRLRAAFHDVAAGFARCARTCREARFVIARRPLGIA